MTHARILLKAGQGRQGPGWSDRRTAEGLEVGIDPERYLTQLLANLPSTPISQLDQWLPDVWKKRQAQTKNAASADDTARSAAQPA